MHRCHLALRSCAAFNLEHNRTSAHAGIDRAGGRNCVGSGPVWSGATTASRQNTYPTVKVCAKVVWRDRTPHCELFRAECRGHARIESIVVLGARGDIDRNAQACRCGSSFCSSEFGVVAVTARNFLVDKSFYEYGHYRGNAVAEIAHDKPKFQGAAYCQSCHAAQFAEWSTRRPRQRRYRQGREMRGLPRPRRRSRPRNRAISTRRPARFIPHNLKLAVPTDTRALCTLCHEQMPGRPLQQAQIVIEDHAGTQQCTLCHNPHSPRTFYGALAAPAHPGDAAAGKSQGRDRAPAATATRVSAPASPAPPWPDRTRPTWPRRSRHTRPANAATR